MSIGKSKPYGERKKYKEERLGKLHDTSLEDIKKIIKGYSTRGTPSFLGGYNNLIQWYRDTTDT